MLNHENDLKIESQETVATVSETINEAIDNTFEKISNTREQLIEFLGETIVEVKPKLRGWFHLISIPIAFIGGLTLLTFTPSTQARGSIAIFVFASVMLFSVSAVYHRSNGWLDAKTTKFLQKTDHASISLLIAGTNTPFAMLLLSGNTRVIQLSIVWSAALFSIILKYVLEHPPRWINVPIYIGLGWFPALFIKEFYNGAVVYGNSVGFWTFILIVSGGVLYSVGGVLFALRPKWLELKKDVFGYHEFFHLFTILAFLCHYAAISLIAYRV